MRTNFTAHLKILVTFLLGIHKFANDRKKEYLN